MEVFPYYDPTPVIPAVIRQQMRSPEPRVQAGARAQAHALLSQHQQPEPWYSCPTCREQVQRKPVEDFVLKSLVRTIAGATGQSSPKRQPALRRAGAAQEDPWYAFFESVEI
jgi:hypothetical protein